MEGKVISPPHAISEKLDRRWRNFVFANGGTSTYHKAKAMEMYLNTIVKSQQKRLKGKK